MSPLALICIVVILAVGGLSLYVYLPIADAIAKGKVLMTESSPYTQTPTSPTMTILVMGDSTAVGTGATPGTSVAGRLGADFPQATITNDSKNGEKLDEFLRHLQARKDERYDLIVFQIGANDIVGLTPESKIASELAEALALAHTIAKHTIVMCAGNIGLSPTFRWPLSALYTARSRTVLASYATSVATYPEMRYVNLFHEHGQEIFETDPKRYYALDHFHPSSDGYGVWYVGVRQALVSLSLLSNP